jgi:hypothetical protein
LAAYLLLFCTVQDAAAQFRIGPQVGWGDDFDLAAGARATANLNTNIIGGTGPLHGILAFDYFLDCRDCTYFEVSPGVYIPFTVRSAGPFVGAGLNIRRFTADVELSGVSTSDTDLGLAVFGGIQLPIGAQMAMADARVALGGSGQLVITVAWLFGGGTGVRRQGESGR